MSKLLPIADAREMRRQAARARRSAPSRDGRRPRPARPRRGHGPRGAAAPRLARAGAPDRHRHRPDRPCRADPRRLPRRADGAHLLRPPRLVRPLRADVRRAARRLHAPCARVAALDGRAGRDRRPRLAHDRRRRRARADDPIRHSRDVDRVRDRAPRRRCSRLGEPDRRAPVHRRCADPGHRDALVSPLRPRRLPVGARRVRIARGHDRRDGRRRPHGRGPRALPASGPAGSTPTWPTRTAPSASRSGCGRSGSRPSTSPTSCPSWRPSPGAAGSSPPGTPRSAR